MSMLARYKKKGGFFQLLNLIETCGKDKQDKFLKMIEEEDLRWSEAVKSKLLTVKRIFSWDDNTIAEFTSNLNDLTLVVATYGLDDSTKQKIYKTMNHAKKRKIEQLTAEKNPTPAEINTSFMQIITEVRRMIQEGYIYLEKVDPALMANSDFEEELLNGIATPGTQTPKPVAVETTSNSKPSSINQEEGKVTNLNQMEVDQLKKMVSHLNAENQKLKEKLSSAESKLLQIKKIA